MLINRPHERQTLYHNRLRTLLLELYRAHTPPALPAQPKAPARGLKRAQSPSSSGKAQQRRHKTAAAAAVEESGSDDGSDTEGSDKAGATSSEAGCTTDDDVASGGSSSSSGKKLVRKGSRASARVVRGTAQSAVAAAAALGAAAPTCAIVGNQLGNERLLTAIRKNKYWDVKRLCENVSSQLFLSFVYACSMLLSR
jgi:hypothetical protein